MNRREYLRDILDFLNENGVEPRVAQGKHLKLTWSAPDGGHRLLVLPVSPGGDHRTGFAKDLARAKRILRADNMLRSA